MKDSDDNFYVIMLSIAAVWALLVNLTYHHYNTQTLKIKTETLSVLTQTINSVDKIENSEELKQELLECVTELKRQIK